MCGAPDVTAVLLRLTPMGPDGQLCLDDNEGGSGGPRISRRPTANVKSRVKQNIESVAQAVSANEFYTAGAKYHQHILSVPGACSEVTPGWSGGKGVSLFVIGY